MYLDFENSECLDNIRYINYVDKEDFDGKRIRYKREKSLYQHLSEREVVIKREVQKSKYYKNSSNNYFYELKCSNNCHENEECPTEMVRLWANKIFGKKGIHFEEIDYLINRYGFIDFGYYIQHKSCI